MFGFLFKSDSKGKSSSGKKNDDSDLNKSEIKVKKSNKANTRLPRDVQESIPYKTTYPKQGIIEDYDKCYSKTYKIEDCNFGIEDEEKMWNMFFDYEKVLNTVAPGMRGQLLIFNKSVDSDTVRNNILMKPYDDGMNHLREQWNDQYLEMMSKGRNNLKKDKYFTISVPADDIAAAVDTFKNVDSAFDQSVRRITRNTTKPMSLDERLELFYNIYNPFADFPFEKKMSALKKTGTIDYNALSGAGISTKDVIGPDSIDLYSSSYVVGDAYTAAFYIDHLPNSINTDILDNISNLSCNMLLSVTYTPLDKDIAIKMVRNQNSAVNAQIATMQRENQGLDYLPSELENAKEQTKDLLSDITKRDQSLFKTTIICVLMASSKDELKRNIESLKTTVNGTMCQCRSLTNQEELAFNTALPLALNQVALDRILTTEEASVFMPFTVQELYQPKGVVYGTNAISKNLIRYDRTSGDSYGGIVIGQSGSGKSYLTKEEISQIYLSDPNSRFVIIDPDSEYSRMAQELKGEVIKIDTSGKYRLNPLDMDMAYAGQGENPIIMKSDYIISLIETMVGGENILSAIDKNTIQRAIRRVYKGYYTYMKEKIQQGITCDKAAMPTLSMLYEELTKMPEANAQIIAQVMENYCTGGIYDTFSYRTNVDVNKRFIVYDVKNTPTGLKDLAAQVCLNDAWNKVIDNNKKYPNCHTYLYIDEAHIFLKTTTAAKFMEEIARRARKYNGVHTLMTQRITDFMINEQATTILNQCKFMLIMNQSPIDRAKIAELYDLSPTLQDFITDRGAGVGIVYTGKTVVPFENTFYDRSSDMHRIMESNKAKVEELEKKEREEKEKKNRQIPA